MKTGQRPFTGSLIQLINGPRFFTVVFVLEDESACVVSRGFHRKMVRCTCECQLGAVSPYGGNTCAYPVNHSCSVKHTADMQSKSLFYAQPISKLPATNSGAFINRPTTFPSTEGIVTTGLPFE